MVDSTEAKSVIRRVRKIKIHRNYDSYTTDFDIALIEMNKPVKFSSGIRPICLVDQDWTVQGSVGEYSLAKQGVSLTWTFYR